MRAIRFLAGASAVYVAVACGSDVARQAVDMKRDAMARLDAAPESGPVSVDARADSGGDAEAGMVAAFDAGADSRSLWDVAVEAVADALPDSLVEPVGEAMAQDGPMVVEAECDVVVGTGPQANYFATAEFPGRSEDELAFVRAILQYDKDIGPGHSAVVLSVLVAPGSVMVPCGGESAGVMSVRFVLR